jgi:hypothetical protein
MPSFAMRVAALSMAVLAVACCAWKQTAQFTPCWAWSTMLATVRSSLALASHRRASVGDPVGDPVGLRSSPAAILEHSVETDGAFDRADDD